MNINLVDVNGIQINGNVPENSFWGKVKSLNEVLKNGEILKYDQNDNYQYVIIGKNPDQSDTKRPLLKYTLPKNVTLVDQAAIDELNQSDWYREMLRYNGETWY